jgi:hypothetical protein
MHIGFPGGPLLKVLVRGGRIGRFAPYYFGRSNSFRNNCGTAFAKSSTKSMNLQNGNC